MNIYEYDLCVNERHIPYVTTVTKTYDFANRIQANDPWSIYDICVNRGIINKGYEETWLLHFDSSLSLLGYQKVGQGNITGSPVPVREIIQSALMTGSVGILLVHNHPSDDCNPSESDIAVTKRVQDACKIMKINFIDHMIIGRHGWLSMLEEGYIKKEDN